jgi:hypothetical protein
VAKQQGGEFELTDPTTRTQDAEFQERGVRPKISLNPRHDLQHIQLPMPPHLSKNAPSLSGLNHADVARSHRRRVISAVEPGKPTSNFQQYDNANTVHTFRKAKIQHSVIVMPSRCGPGGSVLTILDCPSSEWEDRDWPVSRRSFLWVPGGEEARRSRRADARSARN